jgi:Flp pilus assembly protein TadG
MARTSVFTRFRQCAAGISSIEFALLFPVLLVLLLAGGQVVLYVNATSRVQQIATSVSEMLSQATPPSSMDTVAKVNATDLNFSYDASLVIFPYIMADAKQRNIAWRQGLTVSFAGISFTKNSDTCTSSGPDLSSCYTAKVNWTSTGTSTANYRPCTPAQVPVDDSAPYSRSNLPRSLYGDGSIIVVDVSYTFNPTFGAGLVKPVTITRSAYVQPRYATRIDFDTTNTDGIATQCT